MAKENKLKELERVIDEYQDSMFRFAFFRTGSASDSQDIVQDVLLRMYDRGIDLSNIAELKSYLFRSISNRCMNYSRSRNRTKEISLDGAPIPVVSDDPPDIAAEYERIHKIMSILPAEQSEVICMRVLDGLRFTEIAEIMDIPVTTVKSRFGYGINKLKSKIKEDKI